MARISDINPDYPVEIDPHVTEGFVSQPHKRLESIRLSLPETRALLAQIRRRPEAVKIFESSLQGLCQNADGTRLITSFDEPQAFICALEPLNAPIAHLTEILRNWLDTGANEVMFHFGDARPRQHRYSK